MIGQFQNILQRRDNYEKTPNEEIAEALNNLNAVLVKNGGEPLMGISLSYNFISMISSQFDSYKFLDARMMNDYKDKFAGVPLIR